MNTPLTPLVQVLDDVLDTGEDTVNDANYQLEIFVAPELAVQLP